MGGGAGGSEGPEILEDVTKDAAAKQVGETWRRSACFHAEQGELVIEILVMLHPLLVGFEARLLELFST